MSDSSRSTFGQLALALGLATAEQIDRALAEQRQPGEFRPLGEILVQHGVIQPADVQRVLDVLRIARDAVTDAAGPATVCDHPAADAATRASGGFAVPEPATVAPSPPTDAAGRLGGMDVLPTADARYEIIEEIGRGGMGVVYKARQKGLSRFVALKVLGGSAKASAEETERFHREARAAAQLRHPGIVEVHDVGEIDGRPYIAMEYVPGISLSEHLRTHRPDARVCAELVKRVAEAVEHAHARGVIHRDLKPANILVAPDGRPKVADFGLAKEVRGDGHSITRSGAVLGTPQYMAPEQAEGDLHHVDARSDVYSLGVVLYEALTGQRPFDGDNVLLILMKVIGQDVESPRRINPGIHTDLETICLKALEKDAARRFPTAAALAAELGRYLAGEPIEARPVSGISRWARRLRKHRWATALISGALLIVLALCLLLAHHRAERDVETRRAEEAQAALRKAGLVSRVLARWRALAPQLAELERLATAADVTPEDLRVQARPAWEPCQRFLADTPADPASQAAARALAGWARRWSGEPDESAAWLAEAGRLDPDIPLGSLLRALVRFDEYLELQALPTIETGITGIEFGPPSRSPSDAAAALREMEVLLATAERASVWGKEGAEELRSAVTGMRCFQNGDYAGCEQALAAAVQSPDLLACAGSLRMARARARYFQKHFAAALEDSLEVRRLRPRSLASVHDECLIRIGIAVDQEARGEDPRDELQRVIDLTAAGLGWRPGDGVMLVHRGTACLRLAEAQVVRGVDPRVALGIGIDTFTEALGQLPNFVDVLTNRAICRRQLGEVRKARGEDGRPDLELAIQDLEQALRAEPGNVLAVSNLAVVHFVLAEMRARRGESRETDDRRAEESFDCALRLRPDDARIRANRGNLRLSRGLFQLSMGQDPVPELERALADYDIVLRAAPGHFSALNSRGSAHLQIGFARVRQGGAGEASYRSAIADFTAALAIKPNYLSVIGNLGVAHVYLAQALDRKREDSRVEFRSGIECYGQALRLNPKYLTALYNRGQAWGYLAQAEVRYGGDAQSAWRAAIADFDALLSADPNDAEALAHRGLLHAQAGEAAAARGEPAAEDFAAALADADAALRINPRQWVAWCNKAGVLEREQRFAEAAAALEAALKIVPGHPQVTESLARVRARLRK